MSELKSCPFCGGKAKLYPLTHKNKWFCIGCDDVECMGFWASFTPRRKLTELVDRWNRRATKQIEFKAMGKRKKGSEYHGK